MNTKQSQFFLSIIAWFMTLPALAIVRHDEGFERGSLSFDDLVGIFPFVGALISIYVFGYAIVWLGDNAPSYVFIIIFALVGLVLLLLASL